MPTMWGLGHTPKELRELYLSLPLRADYTPEQRQDVLDQVEKNFIPSLRADSEGDSDFWRRQYYGVVVVCDASDEGLAKIHATRPRDADCLRLKPRGGVVPPPKTRESDTGEPSAPAVVIGIKVCDDLVARWATCDPPKLGWTPATLKRDYAWTDDPTKAATERRCKAQLENFPESACHYRK
jgi:hypothetical protein